MSMLMIIDNILALQPVRWLLLCGITLLLVLSAYSLVRQKALSLQLAAANGDKAQYVASLLSQNAAIQKQGEAMQQIQKQAQAARNEADKIKQAWQKRQKQLNEVKLEGTCENMVQQVLDEVRK